MGRTSGVAVALSASCLSLAGCGGSGGPASGEPGAAGRGFLHLLRTDGVTTYTIDPSTGELSAGRDQDLGSDTLALAGEREGRYVYAGHGPRELAPGYNGPDPSIAVYRPAVDGTLVFVSQASSRPIASLGGYRAMGAWMLLSKGQDRIHAVWLTITLDDFHYTYLTHAVSDGQLGPASQPHEFGDEVLDTPVVDPSADLLFSYFYAYGGAPKRPLVEYAIGADGRLTQVASSHSCAGADEAGVGTPLAAVGGSVLAHGVVHRSPGVSGWSPTVCAWREPGLVPQADLGFDAQSGYTFVPPPPASPWASATGSRRLPLVALQDTQWGASGAPERSTLHLVEVTAAGDLVALDAIDVAPTSFQEVLFHPSGRFLYRIGCNGWPQCSTEVAVYALSAKGKLSFVQGVAGGAIPPEGGHLAITSSQ